MTWAHLSRYEGWLRVLARRVFAQKFMNISSPESDSDNDESKPNRLAFMLRALKSRNYRLFFSGQIISLVGNWMTAIAMAWLVYRVTGSEVMLGVVGFVSQLPALLMGPFAGVWIERRERRRVLVVTQSLAMIQSLILAGLALSGRIVIWEILVLGALQGVINAFDMPARQALVVEMVEDKADLSNAIALNSSMVNGSRLVGPALAGLIIATLGEGWCFLIDGISYLAVILSLLMMNLAPHIAPAARNSWSELKEGWNYVTTFKPVRSILLLLAFVSLFGMPYSVLMPVFATHILHGSANTLGYLTTATGVGALTGAMFLASRSSVVGLGRVVPRATAMFGIALILFSHSHVLWMSLLVLPFAGAGFMVQMASCNTVLQTIVDESKRGRVMSFYSMAFIGMMPFGSLLAGFLSHRIGAPLTVMFSGFCCLAAALWFYKQVEILRPIIRPIYAQLGILPEVASGLATAAALTSPPERR